MKLPGFLNNKVLFYALAVLAGLNVVGYLSVRAYECLALFVLTAYSAQCYCKNKSASILAALFVANFVFGCGRVKEGFQEGADKKECKDAKEEDCKGGGDYAHCEWQNNVCQDKASGGTTGGSGSGGSGTGTGGSGGSSGGGSP